MQPRFDLKDTVQFYCPNSTCRMAITYRHLEECFAKESQAWEEGRFACPHCKGELSRKIVRQFDSGGYQWIPECTKTSPSSPLAGSREPKERATESARDWRGGKTTAAPMDQHRESDDARNCVPADQRGGAPPESRDAGGSPTSTPIKDRKVPVRHCVFVGDLAEMQNAFRLPLSHYVDEFLERPTPGGRLREYAELAFADEQEIQTLRKADRETRVMSRRLVAAPRSPRSGLLNHANDSIADYVRARSTSQFKWFLHALAVSGRPWIKELVCGSGREWVEETVNLLFVQRGFSSAPEEGEEYKLAREALLKLTGPFPINEAGHDASDLIPVTGDSFPWVPRDDGSLHFRLVPSSSVPALARTLATMDLSPQAFQDAERASTPRIQDVARENTTRLRSFLQQPLIRPAVLAFITG